MAITTPTLCGPGQLPLVRSAPWAVNNDEDDADAAVELKAAPGAGKALYLTHVTISGQLLDVAVTLKDATTVILGPIQMQADGGSIYTKDFPNPLKLTDNAALNVFATNGVAFTVYVEGFTGTAPVV